MFRAHRKYPSNFMIVALGVLLFLPAVISPVWAMDSGEDTSTTPTGIAPLSNRTALLSFPLSVYPFNEANTVPTIRLQELQELTVVFEDKTDGRLGLDISEDFLPLSTSAINSGLALYKESESSRGFNYAVADSSKDLPIDLSEKPTVTADPAVAGRYTVTFKPVSGGANVQLPFFKDQYADFYVVARTSLNLMQGDRFNVYIPANGIKIRDLRSTLVKNTLYDDPFPSDAFATLNPDFAVPALFEGDIISIVNLISEVENNFRIDASSEATTVLGLDFVGREDQGYFVQEVRVNWLGVNLGAIARLIANLSQANYYSSEAGFIASSQAGGAEQVIYSDNPTFFYSPWFYNAPFDMTTGQPLLTVAPGDGATEMPLTMPLDLYGFPRTAFMLGADDANNHLTSYVSYGPRQPGAQGLTPRVITQDVLQAMRADTDGGIFLFRELGGTQGQYDEGVDHIISLDKDAFRVESFEVSPDAAADPTSPLHKLMRRMLPAQVGGESAKEVIPSLFGDDNLGTLLLGVTQLPDPPESGVRAAYGSLECIEDPDCYFFDLMINVLRPYLGLTEGQIRYLFENTEGNGRTNSEDLFDFNLVQGFTFVLPVAKTNALSDLQAPSDRTGSNSGADIYLAVKTSDNLRNLDSLIPFIEPDDITVGNNVKDFTKGNLTNVSSMSSVSSVGYDRPNTSTTYALIGRPTPRFIYQDLTQPGEGEQAGNTNILYDSSRSSPPKAVIGIDAQDFGQNPNLVDNEETFSYDVFDTFFTESTVFGEMQIDFLPGTTSTVFNPLIFSAIPLTVGVNVEFSRVVSSHSIAIYYDDDTPSGNGYDDDGDGLIDEETYNLQDDDGDGLIDEDLGDGTAAGVNGVYDAADNYLPADRDRNGLIGGAGYAFTPNSLTKFQDYVTAIQSADNPYTITQGEVIPLSVSEGSYFAELDMRVLNAGGYVYPRSLIFPSEGFVSSGSTYNAGMYSMLESRTGLIDLVSRVRSGGGDFSMFPYYPDDLFIEIPDTGEQVWMVNLVSESSDNVRVISDPDGDARRTFALSFASAMRFPNPSRGFVRVGWTPMVIDANGDSGQNPEGESIASNVPYHQFGFDVVLADSTAISDYVRSLIETLSTAYESARTTITDYNDAVAEAEATAAAADPPEDPSYPDQPDPQEVTVTSPYSAFNISTFLETGQYDTNYLYQLQIPDENFGPLEGNDFYVVLRASPQATVGETFRVRIRSGQRNATLTTVDQDAGTSTTVSKPEGGIAYTSFIETDYDLGGTAYRNLSKNQITTGEIVVRSVNVAPSMTFVTPTAGTNVADDNFEYTITFTADDPDNVAEIQLYVDTDNLNYDGQYIPGATLREGYDTSFEINLLDDVENFDPTKSYYIYARLDDGVNQPVYVYSSGSISTTSSSTGTGNDSSSGNSGRVVTGDLSNPLDYVKMRNDGHPFSFGDAPALSSIESTTNVVDMEVTPTFSGEIVVQVDGTVKGAGDLGSIFSRVLQPNGTFKFPTGQVYFYSNSATGGTLIADPAEEDIHIESARDIEVDFNLGAIYVLDGDGDMLFLGNANTNLRPAAMGLDLYRDMELSPNGNQMFFLTGNGILSSAGDATSLKWSNVVADDIYRDMVLRSSGGTVTHILITDADGNITVVGPDGLVKKTYQALKPTATFEEGTIRQIKLFPGVDDVILLMTGGGQPIYLTNGQEIEAPTDRLVFSDDAGMSDDKIVDCETTAINLQSVVTTVRAIMDAFAKEDVDTIMGYVSPDYKDTTGADANGFRQALLSFFQFYEVQGFQESRTSSNSFIITNQGDSIIAQVIVDLSAFYPNVFYDVPTVDSSATTGETTGRMLFSQNTINFDQTITVREVSDGRGWLVDLYTIRNFGRRTEDLINTEDVEYSDITYLLGLTKNTRLAAYVPIKEGVDDPILLKLNISEANPLEPFNVLAVYREPYLTTYSAPPAFEFSMYTGSFLSALNFDTIKFTFSQNSDGTVKLTGMPLHQIMSTNDSTFLSIDLTGSTENPLSSLDGTQVEQPFGFSLTKHGPVKSIFRGESDIIFPDNATIQASYPLGGVMMLPENTDITSLNAKTLVSTQINRTTVRTNPYDPATATGGTGTTTPGYTASLVAGRSYFIITADGKHYGFIQFPDTLIGLDGDPAVMDFSYRYEDTFVLPDNF